MCYQNLVEIWSSVNATKGQRWHFSRILQCLLDSVAFEASYRCEAETGHRELWATTVLIYRQHQLLIHEHGFTQYSSGQDASTDTRLPCEMRRLAKSASTPELNQSFTVTSLIDWGVVGGQQFRIHPAINCFMGSNGQTERWARSCSRLFHGPFTNKDKSLPFFSGSDIHHIVWCCLLEGTDWAELLTLM